MRYAIYCTPARSSDLLEVCEAWFGRSAFGDKVIFHSGPFEAKDHAALTASRARYGFHATIKAPFTLASGQQESDLRAAIHAFGKNNTQIMVGALKVARFGRYLALIPVEQTSELTLFAQTVVEQFSRFRQPLTPQERARRGGNTLPLREQELLDKWGYAATEELFRFHMTLAGPVDEPLISDAQDYLSDKLEPLINKPFVLDTLALFCEAKPPGPFTILETATLPK